MANTEAVKKQQPGKPKKEKKKGRIRRWFKEMWSELKKVSWPTFYQALKKTGVVLLVVLIFLLLMMGFDQLLRLLYSLLVKGLGTGTDATSAIGSFLSLFG